MEKLEQIPIHQVTAVAWSDGRLRACLERLAAGETAPPIKTHRYYLHNNIFYTVSDGNHRVIAAQQRGEVMIAAYIGSETVCKSENYYVDVERGRLWRKQSDEQGHYLSLVLFQLEPELREAFRQIGVKPFK